MIRKPLMLVLALATAHAFAGGGLLFRGGLNIANSTLDPANGLSTSSRSGMEAGVLFDIAASDRVHVLFGGLFDQKGFVLSEDGFSEEADFRLNYFTIPIMLSFQGGHVDASGAPKPAPFLNLGVELSPLTSAEIEFMGASDDYTDATGFDFGLRAEVGMQIPLKASGNALILGAGYSYGLVNSNDADDNLDPPEQHNYVIKVFAAYKLGFAPRPAAAR